MDEPPRNNFNVSLAVSETAVKDVKYVSKERNVRIIYVVRTPHSPHLFARC